MLKINKGCIMIIVCITGCTSAKIISKNISGDYIQERNQNIHLTFNGNDFSFVDPENKHMARFVCCDTITLGKWELRKDLIELTTPQLNEINLELSVEESKSQSEDTVYFYLSNPIEDLYKFTGNPRDISYHIYLKAKGNVFFDRHVGKEYNSNVIAIYKPKNMQIEEFALWVYINRNFGGREIGVNSIETEIYYPKSDDNNVFRVSIPQLSYEFLTYRRLEKDFIRIINKDKLEWDGQVYKKKY